MKYWIGIDPGASGAICALSESGEITSRDFKDGELRGYVSWLKDITDTHGMPVMVGLEKVASMPGQGVKSVFSFGQRLGEIEGMLITLGIGYELIRPQAWQKTCGIPPKAGKKGIHAVMQKVYPTAELLGPQGGIKDGRCDALGIAHALRIKYS